MIDVSALRSIEAKPCMPLSTMNYVEAWQEFASDPGVLPRWLIVPPQLALLAYSILHAGNGTLLGSTEIVVIASLKDQPTRWYVANESHAIAAEA